MVFRLAIVEDEKQDSDLLQSHIHHFFTENCQDDSFQVTVFDNARVFIEQYRPDYDLIFLDIQMPGLNGMEAATALRKKDSSVLLVFVTNMAQYAFGEIGRASCRERV